MPWASYNYSLEDSLSQRPAAVQACVVDCIELVPYISDGHGQAIDLKLTDRASRYFVFSRCTNKTHLPAPSRSFDALVFVARFL
jgi:hypothetical protein